MKRSRIIPSIFILIVVAFVLEHFFAYGETSHGGDIVYTKPLKAVLFSHKSHVEEMGFSCDACHSGLFEMMALSVQEKGDFTMESLYKGKYCGACHNGSMAFASNTQCARCHIGVKGYKRVSDTHQSPAHREDKR
ncbi:MAG: hypothetical protein Fur0020_11620 [Thermodesulfovibrionia bacterium]